MKVTNPQVGMTMLVRGIKCRVVKIHPFGTLDVVSLCGNYAYRVSGLSF